MDLVPSRNQQYPGLSGKAFAAHGGQQFLHYCIPITCINSNKQSLLSNTILAGLHTLSNNDSSQSKRCCKQHSDGPMMRLRHSQTGNPPVSWAVAIQVKDPVYRMFASVDVLPSSELIIVEEGEDPPTTSNLLIVSFHALVLCSSHPSFFLDSSLLTCSMHHFLNMRCWILGRNCASR